MNNTKTKTILHILLATSFFLLYNLNTSGEAMFRELSNDNNNSYSLSPSSLRHRNAPETSDESRPINHKLSKQDSAQELYIKGMKHIKARDSYEKAFEYLTEAINMDQNHLKAQYNLGILYEFGLGTEQSLEEAAKCYSKIANKYMEANQGLTRVIKKKKNSF